MNHLILKLGIKKMYDNQKWELTISHFPEKLYF